MPNVQLRIYSKKYNVPLKKVEEFWEIAKKQYKDDWKAISGTVKLMCRNYDQKNESIIKKLLDILQD